MKRKSNSSISCKQTLPLLAHGACSSSSSRHLQEEKQHQHEQEKTILGNLRLSMISNEYMDNNEMKLP